MTKLSLSAALFGLFASPSALACGGLFCNQSQPVVQAAERIAFAIDSEQQVVEAHVQIFYEGPADEFAWVVPVSSNPDIFLSTDQLFNVLALQLAPLFTLNTIEEGNCDNVRIAPFENVVSNLSVADTGMVLSGSYDDTVDVIQEGQVGPYDMVVLQADQADGLMDWLVENGYDLPPGIEPVLNPYVAEDAHFLALKLSKDRDAGDIAPIGFRYAGTQPAVPIQLTSIAAAPDMRLEAYVFADERVVPESYLHVQINEAAIDWWQGGINYNDVITKAANEAGGHAFGTDYAGPPGFLRGRVWNGDFDVTEQQQIQNFSEFVDTLRTRGLPSTVNMQDALMTCVTPPNGEHQRAPSARSCFRCKG